MTIVKKFSSTLTVLIGILFVVQHATANPNVVNEKANILWLVFEDMSPIISPYGDHTVSTPNIAQLAKEGVTYTNVYSTSGVCAPSRAALAMGMYPSSIGANHMRTTSNADDTGLPKYFSVPPSQAKMLSQYMRESGYYTTNNYKEDYQLSAPKTAWHDSSKFAHWRNNPKDNAFYSVFNFTTTHESGLFEPYGVRKIESRHYFSDNKKKISQLPDQQMVKTQGDDTPIHLPKTTTFDIPPYLPDTPVVQRDMWKMYNNLAEADKQMGAIIAQLKEDGLYDNTLIVFFADHGGPLPRQKRLIYDSGLKVPLIIKYPKSKRAGKTDDRLISFVDFAPSTLTFAGVDIPNHMHGQDFIVDKENKKDYVHAAADRFDGFTDVIRAVKDARFKYIRNYKPEQGYYLPVTYREKIPTMQELLRLKNRGKLNSIQMQWFRDSKPKEELFDTLQDPHELHNLATNPKYKSVLTRLRIEMDEWLTDINDTPLKPESELVKELWNNQSQLPQTDLVNFKLEGGLIYLESKTAGATISFRKMSEEMEHEWQLYRQPIPNEPSIIIEAVAQRLGYAESKVQQLNFNDGM